VRDEIVRQHPEAVQEFVSMLVQAGQFIDQKPETAASIGVPFLDPHKKLGLKQAVLRDVLKEAQGIKTNDMFPEIEALERMQQYMVNEVGIGSLIDLKKFVDIRFAEVACKSLVGYKSILHDVSDVVAAINRQQSGTRDSKASLNLEGKYLAFKVGEEEYGCEVKGVREIIEMKPITVVPHAAPYIKGVINLRGEVVPVIDLGHKLGIQGDTSNKRDCIVVVEVKTDTGPTLAGIAVNSVSDVIEVEAKDLYSGHSLKGLEKDYLLGYVKTSEKIRILLDTQQLFHEV
jgi:chemotaxis signal transduction protein